MVSTWCLLRYETWVTLRELCLRDGYYPSIQTLRRLPKNVTYQRTTDTSKALLVSEGLWSGQHIACLLVSSDQSQRIAQMAQDLYGKRLR
jgi:hypothetical protein